MPQTEFLNRLLKACNYRGWQNLLLYELFLLNSLMGNMNIAYRCRVILRSLNHWVSRRGSVSIARLLGLTRLSMDAYTINMATEIHDDERLMVDLSLYHNWDSTTIRLWNDDTTTHSTTTEVIEITRCVRFDCDTIRRKIDMLIFFLASNWKQAIRRTRSRIVVVL